MKILQLRFWKGLKKVMKKDNYEEITKRWETLGFTEGLSGHCKETMAKLFESEPSVKITDITAEDFSIVRHIADRINFDIKE